LTTAKKTNMHRVVAHTLRTTPCFRIDKFAFVSINIVGNFASFEDHFAI